MADGGGGGDGGEGGRPRDSGCLETQIIWVNYAYVCNSSFVTHKQAGKRFLFLFYKHFVFRLILRTETKKRIGICLTGCDNWGGGFKAN